MKKIVLAIFLVVTIFTGLAAQDGYRIERTVFIPERYYVGDRVELRIRVAADDDIIIRQPQTMPALDWIRFEETMVVPYAGETEIRLVFVPFRPGTRALPDMAFGNLILTDVKIYTSSLITETGREFAPEKGQVPLPGSQVFLAIVMSVGLLIPTALILVISRGAGVIDSIRTRYAERIPSRKLGRALDALVQGRRSISHREYYIRLSEAVKEYLTGKAGKNLTSLTTSELAYALEEVVPPADIRAAIMTILRRSDGVKFAGWGIDHLTREKDAKTVRAIARDVDHLAAKNRKERTHVDA